MKLIIKKVFTKTDSYILINNIKVNNLFILVLLK